MNVNDPTSDMLIRIKNAGKSGHKIVRIPGSKFKLAIAKILKDDGFINDFNFVEDSKQGEIEIKLKYDECGDFIIRGMKRISKPGLRKYVNKDKIPIVLSGYGIAVVSTSKGIVTGREARKLGVGGEVVCFVW